MSRMMTWKAGWPPQLVRTLVTSITVTVPVERDDADLAVLEELAVLGELRDAVERADDVARVDEVGHRPSVVLLHRVGADQADGGTVAVDEPAVLVHDDHVGGDLGQQPVAVDQVAELALELLLRGHVDDHAGVDVLSDRERFDQSLVERRHRRRPDHDAVLEAVGTDDDGLEVEVGQRGAAPERGQDRGEQRLAEVLDRLRSGLSSSVRTRRRRGCRRPAAWIGLTRKARGCRARIRRTPRAGATRRSMSAAWS